VAHQEKCKEPNCNSVVIFDPDDPRHQNFGALLVGDVTRPRIHYLRCGNDHLHRYQMVVTDD